MPVLGMGARQAGKGSGATGAHVLLAVWAAQRSHRFSVAPDSARTACTQGMVNSLLHLYM